jgi:hypothetical protein
MSNRFVMVFYDEISSDPRFDGIRDDLRCMGAWLRLLTLADPIWPAPAPVPAGLPRPLLNRLVAAGLVEILPGLQYRIHGLDSEKERRRAKGLPGAVAKWSARDANADPIADANADPIAFYAGARASPLPSLSPSPTNQSSSSPLCGPQVAFMEVTGTGVSRGSKLWDWIARLGQTYGADNFRQALAEEFAIDRTSPPMKRTELRLQKLAAVQGAAKENHAQAVRQSADDKRKAEESARRRRLMDTEPKPLAELLLGLSLRKENACPASPPSASTATPT